VLFIALGNGSLKEEMKSKIENLGLSENLKLVGFKSEIGDYLKLFDIFTLFSSKEGLGTSILDAMSVGLPIVGTNAGGIPEIIINDENGFLVPKKNPEALANAFLQLIESSYLRQKFGNKSLDLVKYFSVGKMIENNLKLYYEILEEQS
jgi:glycosyltransferase involved in cell wall biosynthesis